MDFERTCRVCWLVMDGLYYIFDKSNELTLAEKLNELVNMQLEEGDGLPDKVCKKCKEEIDGYFDFKCRFEKAEFTMREVLSGIPNAADVDTIPDDSTDPNINQLHIMDEDLANIMTDPFATDCTIMPPAIEMTTTSATSGFYPYESCGETFTSPPFNPMLMSNSYNLNLSNVADTWDHSAIKEEPQDLNDEFDPSNATDDEDSEIDEPPRIPCLECGQILTTTEKNDHCCRESTMLSCGVCLECFKTEKELIAHRKLHPNPFQCPLCPLQFRHKYRLTNHIQRHTGEKAIICKLCRKTFFTNFDMKRHAARVHDKKWK